MPKRGRLKFLGREAAQRSTAARPAAMIRAVGRVGSMTILTTVHVQGVDPGRVGFYSKPYRLCVQPAQQVLRTQPQRGPADNRQQRAVWGMEVEMVGVRGAARRGDAGKRLPGAVRGVDLYGGRWKGGGPNGPCRGGCPFRQEMPVVGA